MQGFSVRSYLANLIFYKHESKLFSYIRDKGCIFKTLFQKTNGLYNHIRQIYENRKIEMPDKLISL